MPIIETLIGPIAGLIDKIVPDPKARDAAKLELLRLERGQELELLRTQLSALLAEAQAADRDVMSASGTVIENTLGYARKLETIV